MRNTLCSGLIKISSRPEFVFLTGDLGFNALEGLQSAAGERFINAGVAEQNMISAAAGMASTGLSPWAYSIAPFVYARPFEQIRNDVCLHDLPVKLIGNGGGYGYGVMGATHHAIEDYGAMLCLQNMSVFVPAFSEDVHDIIEKLADFRRPAYFRLGRCEKPDGFEAPRYAPWRKIVKGEGSAVLTIGPIAGSLIETILNMPSSTRPALWVVSELPLRKETIPEEFMSDIERSRRLTVVEEHVATGGVGQALAALLLEKGVSLLQFKHHFAKGYLSGTYGSQAFHRKESGLDPYSILAGN